MKLTDGSVAGLKLPEGKSELLVFDDSLAGFGLRIRGGGKRTWIAQYRIGAATAPLKPWCGRTSRRRRSPQAREGRPRRVQLGQDPQAEKTAVRAPKARELTLGDVVDRYLPYAERKLKASTYSGVVMHLRKHWQPLHAHEIQNLERRHIAAELGRIAASSGPYGANRSRAALSAIFAWAIGEGAGGCKPGRRHEQGDG